MASTAGQISRELFCFDFRRLVAACSPAGATLLAGEDLTARAVASAGLAALFVLPFLLLSSVVLAAPLAVPAAIGLGYLAVSHAIAARNRRRAALINAFVLCGLVGWLFFFMLAGGGPLSHAGLVAALMAPLFAAAPALAHSLMARRRSRRNSAVSKMRDTALDRVACLDELTPDEQVLVLDAEGTVLAATAAARRGLPLLPDAFEHRLNSIFANEVPPLLEVIDRCKARVEGADVNLTVDLEGVRPVRLGGRAQTLNDSHVKRKGRALTATVSPCSDGTFAMRLQERRTIESTAMASEEANPCAVTLAAEQVMRPSCDIGEALAFALRHTTPKAEAMQIALTSTIEPDLAAACDRQIGRRVLHLLIESALSGSEGGGTVHVIARRLKGVVLLRVTSEVGTGALGGAETDDRLDGTALRNLVESAGGTLVVDRVGHDIALSVRLDSAFDQHAGGRECRS